MLSRIEIEKRLKISLPELKSDFKVKSIGLFGSAARNSNTKRSDIDILVEFSKGHKDFFNYFHLKEYLENILDSKVDLVIKEAVKPGLREIIFREVRYV